ncbi:helix-turn-helix transcriptional regulator [Weissella minor]|uniref:helix-turn-helix domain-containing protein n=1 Tax=Weissella minor TaxID=1620 RepID=UPI001BB0613E|nr:helix-turn-helix transcriptional regulator [Weissella minor]MBS0950547.1 helix-turn-helix transcriptional regulator [Weissella minor]
MTLFERVKETSKNRGWSLAETSKKAGLGQRTLYQWKDKQPSADKLKSVADVLGVSVDYLLGNSDEMHTQSNLVSDADLESAFDGAESFDGKPLTEQDKRIMKNLLISYMESKD